MRRFLSKSVAVLLVVAFAAIAVDVVSKSIKPRLNFLSTEKRENRNGERIFLHYNLKNPSFRPIYVHSIESIEVRARGEWADLLHENIFCGVGIGWHRFAAFGESEWSFTIPVSRKMVRGADDKPIDGHVDEMRVGVDYRYSEDGESHMVWSEPIRLDELIPDWNN